MLKLALKIFDALLGLTALAVILLFFVLFGMRTPDCERGPLGAVASCDNGSAMFSWQNSGYYYFHSRGPIQADACRAMLAKDRDHLEWPNMAEGRQLTRHDCAPFFKTQSTPYAACYSGSRLSSNFNTRYFWAVATTATCDQGVYFEGSRRALLGGDVVEPPFDLGEPLSEYYPAVARRKAKAL